METGISKNLLIKFYRQRIKTTSGKRRIRHTAGKGITAVMAMRHLVTLMWEQCAKKPGNVEHQFTVMDQCEEAWRGFASFIDDPSVAKPDGLLNLVQGDKPETFDAWMRWREGKEPGIGGFTFKARGITVKAGKDMGALKITPILDRWFADYFLSLVGNQGEITPNCTVDIADVPLVRIEIQKTMPGLMSAALIVPDWFNVEELSDREKKQLAVLLVPVVFGLWCIHRANIGEVFNMDAWVAACM